MFNPKTISLNKSLFLLLLMITIILLIGCNPITNPENIPIPTLSDGDHRQEGVVEYVIDGDTFDVKLDNGKTERVRAILVNTPEICHKSSPPDCETEPYASEATDFTRELLTGKRVYLETDTSLRDPYDRLLAYVYLEDGSMYQELILQEGFAKIMAIKPNVKYQSQLEAIEQVAKAQHVNVWSN